MQVWQAGLATAAAPTYFDPVVIEGSSYVDGGVLFNNPTEVMLQEIDRIWKGRKIGCIVSVGCGRVAATRTSASKTASTRLPPMVQAMVRVSSQTTDTECIHRKMLEMMNIPFEEGDGCNGDDRLRTNYEFGNATYNVVVDPSPMLVSTPLHYHS